MTGIMHDVAGDLSFEARPPLSEEESDDPDIPEEKPHEIPLEHLQWITDLEVDSAAEEYIACRREKRTATFTSNESLDTADHGNGLSTMPHMSSECPSTRLASPPSGTGSFIRVSRRPSQHKKWVAAAVLEILNSSIVESLIGVLIMFNFMLICMETDSRSNFPGRGAGSVPSWVADWQVICFVIFCIELFMRIIAEGANFHKNLWNLLDSFIILIGTVDYVLLMSGFDTGAVSMIRVIRLCRLLRLIRVMRLFTILKELRRLLQMMGSCFKTLFWSFLLLMLVMTIWAIVAVEVVNPVVQRAADAGAWPDCERCRRSFASVFMANITFFQTVVAGDSWGYIAIPVIEEEPITAIVFVGSLLTLVFGVLNLIVAVIVDTFAETREKDVLSRAAELDEEEKEQKKMLAHIFNKVDTDKSGSLNYEELLEGAGRVPEFSRWLRVMDIDTGDLAQLFKIVDADGSGEIDPSEFIEAMYRMRTADAKTATKFVKHIVTRLDERTSQLEDRVINTLPDMAKIDKRVKDRLKKQERRLQETIEDAVQRASAAAVASTMQALALNQPAGLGAGLGGTGFVSQGSRSLSPSPSPSAPSSPRRSPSSGPRLTKPAKDFNRSGDALAAVPSLEQLSLDELQLPSTARKRIASESLRGLVVAAESSGGGSQPDAFDRMISPASSQASPAHPPSLRDMF